MYCVSVRRGSSPRFLITLSNSITALFINVINDKVVEYAYICKKYIFTVTPFPKNVEKPTGMEDVWVTLQCKKLPSIIICCLYRHPKAPTETFDYIKEVFKMLWLTKNNFNVLGDFTDDCFSSNSNI